MQPACSQFIAAFRSAFAAGHFVKATLSKPGPVAAEGLKNVYLRPVALKSGMHVAFNYRYSTRDEVKNYLPDEAEQHLEALLGSVFLHADMFTGEADWILEFGKNGHAQVSRKRATSAAPPTTAHNREKHRLLDPSALWLHRLGITNARGEVLPTAQDKWRQINKYLEIIEGLLRDHPLPADARIADMGSGKGYLTFALYDFLAHRLGMRPQVTGIELRPKLVEFCEKTAREARFDGLRFRSQDIAQYHPERLDMLIALHACDTATDLALAAGIRERAALIVAAPCCHKQIRKALHTRNELAPLLRHGILEERQAEIITDGLRALLLEAEGYRTAVFEFISTEHTAKNVMIAATRYPRADAARRADMLSKVQAIKQGFGIDEHYLERLLRERPEPPARSRR
ncbi:MAG TPA: SAM-dependent methyltransferase [Saprospiraceae bacterium]|nr:SAM-dependent methyltransferase [Saprospiraceae bacterium]